MKILHTSDWHLGRQLYGKKRDHEFAAFLEWLLRTLTEQNIDVLLVAGDIFDTTTPNYTAQTQYYQFLGRIATTPCQHVVIIAGNHDSPAFLQAPQHLLRSLQIHVIGTAENPAEEVLELVLHPSQERLLVGAVPYLRDRDIRTIAPGETIDDKNRKLLAGITEHYQQVVQIAVARQQLLAQTAAQSVPIILMGHLFAAGGSTVEGDGVRELYVGSLLHVGADVFTEQVDYVALGHLHRAQKVAGNEFIRYSGTPLAMGFGEVGQEKVVLVFEWQPEQQTVTPLAVPVVQPLHRVVGSWETIVAALTQLRLENRAIWLEVEYQASESRAQLSDDILALLADSPVQLVRVKNRTVIQQTMQSIAEGEQLVDYTPEQMFLRYLDEHTIAEEERPALMLAYQTILAEMQTRSALEESATEPTALLP